MHMYKYTMHIHACTYIYILHFTPDISGYCGGATKETWGVWGHFLCPWWQDSQWTGQQAHSCRTLWHCKVQYGEDTYICMMYTPFPFCLDYFSPFSTPSFFLSLLTLPPPPILLPPTQPLTLPLPLLLLLSLTPSLTACQFSSTNTLLTGLLIVVMLSSLGDRMWRHSHLQGARSCKPLLPGNSSVEMLMR